MTMRTPIARPKRVEIAPSEGPCPPIWLTDCPTCTANAGERCIGIDRDDEVHADRMTACIAGLHRRSSPEWRVGDVQVVNLCGICGQTFEIAPDDPHWSTGRGPICPKATPTGVG